MKMFFLAFSSLIMLTGCGKPDNVRPENVYVPIRPAKPLIREFNGFNTVRNRVAQYGYRARNRLTPYFEQAGVEYPPKAIVLVGLKKERRLQLYAGSSYADLQFIRSYPVRGASGFLGPKLRAGDRQVPEGVYRVDAMNPNSSYHLSLRVNYPNAFDRRMARIEGRYNLGGNIFIHGKDRSAGCLAMGDSVAEELFVLVADNKTDLVRVILSPMDFRSGKPPIYTPDMPAWTRTLYRQIKQELTKLPAPTTTL